MSTCLYAPTSPLTDDLLELEQATVLAGIVAGFFLREMRIGMAVVVVLGNREAAAVHVEVDVALLVIRRDQLPMLGVGIAHHVA